jgi:hypothetical protein
MGKPEIIIRPETEVIDYYAPFLQDDKYVSKVYILSNYDSAQDALNSFGTPRVFLKNRVTGVLYELDCFEDLQANIDDINNNAADDYIVLKNKQDLFSLEEFVNDKKSSKMILSSGESKGVKKWDVYISYATFLGKKLRKLTLPVTGLNDINEVVILNLSFHKDAAALNQ